MNKVLAQALGSVFTGLMTFSLSAFLMYRIGEANFGKYSALMLLGATFSVLESASQQIFLRVYAKNKIYDDLGGYWHLVKPVALMLAFLMILITTLVYLCSCFYVEKFGSNATFLTTFAEMKIMPLLALATGFGFYVIAPYVSYALISAGNLVEEAYSSITGTAVRTLLTVTATLMTDEDYITAICYGFFFGALIDLSIRALMLRKSIKRASFLVKGFNVGFEKSFRYIGDAKKESVWLLTAPFVIVLDRWIASSFLTPGNFGIFSFVYSVVQASAIIPNAYGRSIMVNYWAQKDTSLLAKTLIKLSALAVVSAVASAIVGVAFLAFKSAGIKFDGAFNTINGVNFLFPFALALSAILLGVLQFACFAINPNIWKSALLFRILVSVAIISLLLIFDTQLGTVLYMSALIMLLMIHARAMYRAITFRS